MARASRHTQIRRAWRDWEVKQNTYITKLMNRGFTYADAYEWRLLALDGRGHSGLALDIPCSYRDAGFTANEGKAWFTTFMDPDDAVDYANRGWTPTQVRRLRLLIHLADNPDYSFGGGPGDRRPIEVEWVHTDIAPHYVLLYLRAGHAVATAALLDARRRAGDTNIEPALSTLAALRGGGCDPRC